MVVLRPMHILCLCHEWTRLQYFKCVFFTYCRRLDIMVRFFHTVFASGTRRHHATVLAFSWFLGLASGAYSAASADISNFSLMLVDLDFRVSIFGLLAVQLLPLLFSAFAVYISCFWLLISIAFWKAFSYAYVCTGLMLISGSGGILLCCLFLFSDVFSVPLLCWFWLKAFERSQKAALRCAAALVPAITAIVWLDHQFVSPFLVNL